MEIPLAKRYKAHDSMLAMRKREQTTLRVMMGATYTVAVEPGVLTYTSTVCTDWVSRVCSV